MNFASLELCKELYELSGWKPEPPLWKLPDRTLSSAVPNYDLGYLLRKLPVRSSIKHYGGQQHWGAHATPRHQGDDGHTYTSDIIRRYATTPEDAACKLAIALFKQGVLTK